MKEIIVTLIPTDFITNSLLSLFCILLKTKNKNQISTKLVV